MSTRSRRLRPSRSEEPLNHRLIRRHDREPAELRYLLIRQESARHDRSTYGTSTVINRLKA